LTPAFSELFSLAAKLAPEDRALVAKGLVSASGDPRYVDSLTKLLASSDFKKLSPDDKNAVLTYAKNHSSEIDLDRNWVMKLMLDTGYEERYQEKQVATFPKLERDLIHEIETQRGCRSNEGFQQWLSLRPQAERGFYHAVYAPLLNPGPLGRREGEVLPKPPAVHSAADVQDMLPWEKDWLQRTGRGNQDKWIAEGHKKEYMGAFGYTLYLEGADEQTCAATDGILMASGAVAPLIGSAPLASPSRAPEVQDMSRSAPAPEVEPLPQPNAPHPEVEAPAAPTPTTNPTIGELQPAAAPTAATPGFNKLNEPVTLPQANVYTFPNGSKPGGGPAPVVVMQPWRRPDLSPRAQSTVPLDLLVSAGDERPGGSSPSVHPDPPTPTGPPRTAGGRQTAPVDPNARRTAGGNTPNGGGPDSSRQPPASASHGEEPADPATAPPVDPTTQRMASWHRAPRLNPRLRRARHRSMSGAFRRISMMNLRPKLRRRPAGPRPRRISVRDSVARWMNLPPY
jgi:hypothetical protein